MMTGCIFCRIVKGEVPSYKVYEDPETVAFLDIRPLNPGHVLVVPKRHYRWVWDVPGTGDYFKAVDKVANAIRKSMGSDWVVSWIIGELVPHAHVNLMPRLPEDGHGNAINFNAVKEIPKEQMMAISEKIRKALVNY
ncbi:MAG: HIT domain-containing protein [Candidatus Aenigmatarchaeota archaeon]